MSPPAAWSATRLARRCARRQPPCMVDISPPLVSIPTGSRTFASCWSMLELVQCSYYTSLSLQYCTGFQITSRGQRAAQRAKSHSAHAPPREPRRSCRLTDRRTAHIHTITFTTLSVTESSCDPVIPANRAAGRTNMQFLCCNVRFLMYAHVARLSGSWLGSILGFSD